MRHHLASICIRLALVFVLVSSAIGGFVSPHVWGQYIPAIISQNIPVIIVLGVFGAYEIILAIFFLFKKNVALTSLLAAITFVLLAFLRVGDFENAMLYVALALCSLALLFIGKIRA